MNRVKIVMIIIIGLVLLSPSFSEEKDPNGIKTKEEAKEVSTGKDVRKEGLGKEERKLIREKLIKRQRQVVIEKARDPNAYSPKRLEIIRKAMERREEMVQRMGEMLDKQLADEKTKHSKRVARLERIRDLGVNKKDLEIVSRVDNLLEKELGRHKKKIERLEARRP